MDHFHCLVKIVTLITQSKDDFQNVQKELLTIIYSIKDENVSELLAFVADDLMCQRVSIDWFPYMLELKLFNTCLGGEKFFERLEFFLKTANTEMVWLYCFAIKFGFLGKFNEFPTVFFQKCQYYLQIANFKPTKPKTNGSKRIFHSLNWFLLLGVPITIYLIVSCCEMFFLHNLPIKEVASLCS